MKTNFFKNLSYLTLIQISNTLIPLLIIPYLARIITQENFGNLEFSRYFCYYFSIIINYGFDVTSTRSISINRDNKVYLNSIISQTIYAKLFLLLLSTTLFFTIIEFSPLLQELYFLLSVTFIINIGFFLFPLWYFQGIEDLPRISVLNFALKVIIALLTILLIKKNSDYAIFNGLQSLALIIIGLVSLFVLVKYRAFVFQKINFSFISSILKEGFPVFMSTILITYISTIFFIFLKIYSNDAELGMFSTSNKVIASFQAMILLPFSQAFFPIVAKQVNENFLKFKKNILFSSIIIFILTFFAGLIIYLYPDKFIQIIFGHKYLSAVESLKILAFVPMFMLLNNVFSFQGLLALKKDKLFLYIHFFGAIVTTVLCFCVSTINAINVAKIRLFIEIILFLFSLIFYFKTIKNKKDILI